MGIGAVGTAVYGMAVLGEPVTTDRILGLVLIVGGVVGLKFLHQTQPDMVRSQVPHAREFHAWGSPRPGNPGPADRQERSHGHTGGTVTVTGIITAIVFGLIIGVVARLVVPGKQNIPIWLTILVGIVGAFIGTFLAQLFGAPTGGINFIEIVLQIAVAAVGVVIVAGAYGRRRVRH